MKPENIISPGRKESLSRGWAPRKGQVHGREVLSQPHPGPTLSCSTYPGPAVIPTAAWRLGLPRAETKREVFSGIPGLALILQLYTVTVAPRKTSEKQLFQRAGCISKLEKRKWKYPSSTTNQSFLPSDQSEKINVRVFKKLISLTPHFYCLENTLRKVWKIALK